MNISKHTSGPWKGYKDQGVYAGDDEGDIVFQTGCGCCTESKLTQADADLIAAAPDLLAVLQELQESASYWSEYDVPLGIVDRINSAIAKATGEQI